MTFRAFSLLAVFMLCLTAPALAQRNSAASAAAPTSAPAPTERPRLDVLGFSADGRFFAYRQSGLVDNGQAAFADLFVQDVIRQAPVQGTPLRVKSSRNLVGLAAVRSALEAQSASLLRRLGLTRALAGVAFVPRDRGQMFLDLPWGERIALRLTARHDLKAPGCAASTKMARESLAGFHLTLQRTGSVEVIHNDKSIPRSRGCAVSYRFASGFIKPRGTDAVIAAVIAYREIDSSGKLRTRYTAITAVVKAG